MVFIVQECAHRAKVTASKRSWHLHAWHRLSDVRDSMSCAAPLDCSCTLYAGLHWPTIRLWGGSALTSLLHGRMCCRPAECLVHLPCSGRTRTGHRGWRHQPLRTQLCKLLAAHHSCCRSCSRHSSWRRRCRGDSWWPQTGYCRPQQSLQQEHSNMCQLARGLQQQVRHECMPCMLIC